MGTISGAIFSGGEYSTMHVRIISHFRTLILYSFMQYEIELSAYTVSSFHYYLCLNIVMHCQIQVRI